MYNIAVLGDRDSVCGFACAGIEACTVYNDEEAEKELRRMAESGYAVIFITEYYAEKLSDYIAKYEEAPVPAIIPIPGVSGNSGLGMSRISEYVEKAVGSIILD